MILLLGEILHRRTGLLSVRLGRLSFQRGEKAAPPATAKSKQPGYKYAAAPPPTASGKKPAGKTPPAAEPAPPPATPRESLADALSQARDRARKKQR
jgi:hypothetical protein